MTSPGRTYLYFTSDLQRAGVFDDASLAPTTERHHIDLAAPPLDGVDDRGGRVVALGGRGRRLRAVIGAAVANGTSS